MEQVQEKESQPLELPRSIGRVLRFIHDYSYIVDTPDEDHANTIAAVGLRSSGFANKIIARQDGSSFMLQALKVRHGVFSLEIREFALWLRGSLKHDAGEEPSLVLAAPRKAKPVEGKTRRRVRQEAFDSDEDWEEEEVEGPIRPKRRKTRRLKEQAEHREPIEAPSTRTARMIETAAKRAWPAFFGTGFGVGSLLENGIFEVVRPPMAVMSATGAASGYLAGYGTPFVDINAIPYPTDQAFAFHNRLVPGLLRQVPIGRPLGPSRDLLADRPSPGMTMPTANSSPPAGMPYDPRMGQVTLVAPPVKVASPDLAKSWAAVSFDWRRLAKGAAEMNPSSFEELRKILPPGSQALYPALPQDSLGPSAVNVPLAAETIGSLVEKGYGQPPSGWAESIEAMSWSTPPALSLSGTVLPTGPRALDDQTRSSSADSAARPAQADTPRYKGVLDFFGIPTHFAPTPDSPHSLPDRHVARSDLRGMPVSLLAPQLFSGFQRKAFPHFQSISAVPHETAWHAAPKPLPPIYIAGHPAAPYAPSRPQIVINHPPAIPARQHRPMVSAPSPFGHAARATPIGVQHAKPLIPTARPTPAAPVHPNAPSTPRRTEFHPPSSPIARPTPVPGPQLHANGVPSLPVHEAPALHTPTVPQPHPLGDQPVHHDVVHTLPVVHHETETDHRLKAPAPKLNVTTVVKPSMPLHKGPVEHPDDKHLAVQASSGGSTSTPAAAGDTKTAGSSAGGQGSKDAEVGLLANEVWSLLKRRLEFESQRAGRH